jgi:hypothetical protein
MLTAGLSNPQIGERMYISRRTVQTHVAHIFMKLGVSSRAQLAAEVIRQPSWRIGHLADVPRGGRLSRRTACGPGSA